MQGIHICIFHLIAASLIWPLNVVAKDHHCSKKSLKIKSCHINEFGYQLHFTEGDKLVINDGTWREVEDMPLKGKGISWHDIWVEKFDDRVLISTLLWDKPEGEGEIQSLLWTVLELTGPKIEKKLSQVVQKRRISEKQRKPAQFKDAQKSFGLSPGKDKKIYWWNSYQFGHF